MTIRIVAWNVAHQEKSRLIPPRHVTALISLQPDVIVLTEFVPAEKKGRERTPFYDALNAAGMNFFLPLCSHEVSNGSSRNHVLIASRLRMDRGELHADSTYAPGPMGFLHARFPDDGFEVVGMRVPFFETTEQMKRHWEWLTGTLTSIKDRPIVVAGDINLNVRQPKPKYKGKYVEAIEPNWTIPDPKGGGSFISKTGKWNSIDHAFVSKQLEVVNAEYVAEKNGYIFASAKCDMSDHAVLLVDVKVGQR